MEAIVVGYWSPSPDDDQLPYPHASPGAWERQDEFVAKLRLIEQAVRNGRCGRLIAYRGFSMCRLCGKPNGHEEFDHGGYRWPSGLLHYVEHHNVRLPSDFIDKTLRSEA